MCVAPGPRCSNVGARASALTILMWRVRLMGETPPFRVGIRLAASVGGLACAARGEASQAQGPATGCGKPDPYAKRGDLPFAGAMFHLRHFF